jgi:hypothetical protein
MHIVVRGVYLAPDLRDPHLIGLTKLCSTVLFAWCRFVCSVLVRVGLQTTPCTLHVVPSTHFFSAARSLFFELSACRAEQHPSDH